MAGKSDYLELKVLDHVLGGGNYTRAATIDIALYTSSPSDSGGGTEVSTSGTAYARITVTNDGTFWNAASGGSKTNNATAAWATATANWGTVVAAALFEGGTSNMLYYGNLVSSRVVNTGDSVRFIAGGIVVTED